MQPQGRGDRIVIGALFVVIAIGCGLRVGSILLAGRTRQQNVSQKVPHLSWLGVINDSVHSVKVKKDRIDFFGTDQAPLASICRDGERRLRGGLTTEKLLKSDCESLERIDDGPVELHISVWDPEAIVFITAGNDRMPGVAAVDDDGNAAVDDRSELGATGSDDVVLTPNDEGYSLAMKADAERSDTVVARLSRGAMKSLEPTERASGVQIDGPGQIRIDVIASRTSDLSAKAPFPLPRPMSSRIVDLKGDDSRMSK